MELLQLVLNCKSYPHSYRAQKTAIAHSSSLAVPLQTRAATQNTRHCFTADNHDQPDLPYRRVF